jgi:Glycosyl hydrolase family 12
VFLERRVIPLLAVIASAITLFIANVNPAAADGLPPANGVPIYNARVCGTDWVDIHIPMASYYNVYNDDFGRETCVVAELHHLDFRISSAGNSYGFDAYPNISSGWEDNKYTCTGHAGQCFTYPVRADHDGDPVTSIAGWLAPGSYDFSYDIWFNKTDAHPLQDNGTELMIWLAHPGIPEGVDRAVTIDGIKWDVTTWITNHPGEPHWRLLIYYAVHPRSSAALRLNNFFTDAERHAELSSSEWLTAIDAGFELAHGGVGDNIHQYSLTGLPASQ